MRVLAGLSFAIFCWLALQFSWGGQAFSPRAKGQGMVRSFRPTGQIVAFQTRQRKPYSVSNLSGFSPLSLDGRFTDFETFSYSDDAVLLRNGSKHWGSIYWYRSFEVSRASQKTKAFDLTLPFLQTNLAIFLAEGMSYWEANARDGVASRWCTESCKFLLKNPGCEGVTLPTLLIAAPRPDSSSQKPISVAISMKEMLPKELSTASTRQEFVTMFRQLPLQLQPSPVIFTDLKESKTLNLPTSPRTWGWIIELKTNRSFNPLNAGMSQDDRHLGIKVLDLSCQSTK